MIRHLAILFCGRHHILKYGMVIPVEESREGEYAGARCACGDLVDVVCLRCIFCEKKGFPQYQRFGEE